MKELERAKMDLETTLDAANWHLKETIVGAKFIVDPYGDVKLLFSLKHDFLHDYQIDALYESLQKIREAIAEVNAYY